MKWYLIVALICTFLMANDIGHLFMCLSATYISSLKKCLFRSFAHFLLLFIFLLWLPWWLIGKESACNEGDVSSIPGFGRAPGGGNGNSLQYSCLENPMDRGAWRAILLLLSCTTPLCILYNTSPLANTWLAKFFSYSLGCFFHFLSHFLVLPCNLWNLSSWIRDQTPALEAWSLNLWTAREVSLFYSLSWWCPLKCKGFDVNDVQLVYLSFYSFRSLNHFELIFVYGVMKRWHLIL